MAIADYYGAEELAAQEPLKVEDAGDVWRVSGSRVRQQCEPRAVEGVCLQAQCSDCLPHPLKLGLRGRPFWPRPTLSEIGGVEGFVLISEPDAVIEGRMACRRARRRAGSERAD